MDNRIPIQLVLDDRNFLLQAKRAVDSIPLKKSIEFDSAPLKRITGDFNEFGKSLDAAVARVISFTATTRLLQGFGNSIAGITRSAIEVEDAMTRVQSILGTTASQTKQFKKDLFDLANSGSTDFYKVAEAAEEFSRQGFTLAKTIEATKAAMVLAKLSGSDLKKTIEGVTAVMATASNQTLEFIDVTDKIAAVDAKFATSSAGLLDGLKRFGGIAEQNGLVLDQQLGLLASIKQLSGRSEAVIGNSIKSLLVSFSNSNVQKELENIGVSVKDSEGNFKDLVQVGKELAAVYDTLSASQQAFIRQKVGKTHQSDAFEQFIRASRDTGGGSLVDKAIGVSENSTGSSLKRIETLNSSTKSQLEIFKNTLTQFGDAIGSKLTKPVVDEFISVVNTLGSVFSNNSEVAGVGEKIGNGIITGIKNVITQPGLVVGGVLLTNLIKKIGGDALRATTSILGVSKYKKDIAAIEQVQVATIMPKINEYDLKRIASLTTQAEKEREILNILNAQIKARNAAGQVNQFLNTIPGVTNTNRLFTKTIKTKADGGLPEAFFKEAVDVSNGVGGATPHARPKKMMLNVGRGPEIVVVNSDERIIRNFGGSGQDAVLNREMMGYAGGYIGPTKRLLKHLTKRKVDIYRDDTEPAQYSGTTLLNGKAINRHININSKTPIFDLIHESGHDIDRGNLYKFGKPLTKRSGLDVLNVTDRDIYNERVANKNAISLMKKLGYGDEVIKKYVKDSFKPFTTYSRKGYPKPGALKNISNGFVPSLARGKKQQANFQQSPFSFNAGDQRDMTQTVGTSNFRPRFNTSSKTSTGTSYPQGVVSYTGDSSMTPPQINKINLPIKQVLIDAFSDNGVQSTVKKSFGESFKSGIKSVVSNSLGGGKIGNAIANTPSFLVDAIESIRRPNSHIPKNKFFSSGLRGDLSKLSDSKIDSLSPYGDPNTASSKAIREEIASRNEAFRDSIRRKKEARETRKSARSAKLAGAGFGASFFGGVASELLTGRNGEETSASRASNSISQSIGLTASVASINPAIGAVVGAGLLVKETSNLINEITAGGAYDSAAASYKKLTDEVSKSEASIISFTEAATNLNGAIESGDTTKIEMMVKSLTSAYNKLPSEFSSDLGKLNFDNPQDISKIQELFSKFQEKNKRETAQKEFELKFQEYRKSGVFGDRRDTTLLGFASKGTDNADAFAAALLEGIDVSTISNDIKEKIKKNQELTIQDYNSILPDSTFKRQALASTEFRDESSLPRFAVNEALRGYVKGFDIATKQAEAQKKSLDLSSFLKSELDNYQFYQDKKFDRTGLKLEELSKSLELSSDTLTEFGRATSQVSLSILKSKLDVEKNLSSAKNDISKAVVDFLASRTLNPESANTARESLKTFNQSGDFSKLLTDLKSSVGSGSIREVEDIALKNLPILKRESESLLSIIASQKNSLLQEQKTTLTNNTIRTLGSGKVITPEQLLNIRSGISAQLQPRKGLEDVDAKFVERGGFGLSNYNLSKQERAFRTVQINRQNADIGEKSLSSIQDLDSIGLLGIPTDPSTKLGQASKELRNLTKLRAKRDFLNVSKSNQQNSVKSILDGYFSEINSSSKKQQGFNLIPEDLRKSINQDIAFSDFGSAKNRFSKFSESVPDDNKNKPLLEEVIRILDINDIISKNSSEVAAAFADKLIKNKSGDELINKVTELNNIQTQLQKSVSSLESYFTSKFKEERTSINSGIISKEKGVSLGLKNRIEQVKSNFEDNERLKGKSFYSKQYSDKLEKELSGLRNLYNESQAKIGSAKFDNIVNAQGGVGAGIATEFSPLVTAISGVSDKITNVIKSIGDSVTPVSKEVKVLQESTANILVGVDIQQILSGTEAIKEVLSREITNIVSTIFKENGFNIKTKPK